MRHPFSIFRTQAALAGICAGLLFAAFPGDQAAAATYRTLPAGTSIVGALQSTVSSRNEIGDQVRLRTVNPIRRGGVTVLPANSTVYGEVTHRDGPGEIAGAAHLTMRFTRIVTPDGRSYQISAVPIRLKGKNDAGKSAKQVGIGAAAGGVLGGVLGGKDDILKGAAAGAVVGTGVAVATKGKHIVLPAGQRIRVELNTPVSVRTRSTTS